MPRYRMFQSESFYRGQGNDDSAAAAAGRDAVDCSPGPIKTDRPPVHSAGRLD